MCDARRHATRLVYAYLVFLNLLLDVVLQQVAKPLLVPVCQPPHSLLELLLVEDVAHAQPTSRHLRAVRWADALLRCADQPASELYLFQPIDQLMHIEHDLRPIAYEDPAFCVQPLLL